jgi:hypothetical protein
LIGVIFSFDLFFVESDLTFPKAHTYKRVTVENAEHNTHDAPKRLDQRLQSFHNDPESLYFIKVNDQP